MTDTPTRAEAKWQPIETAPNDGTVFFAWCPHVGRVIMRIDGVHRETWAVDLSYRLGCRPTLWTHLPAPPDRRHDCSLSHDGRHHVDTSMESGPNNCFHCGEAM